MTIANDLVSFYIGLYNTGKVSLTLLFTVGVSKDVFLSTYKSFIKEEILIPIEKLPNEEKLNLAAECKETGLNFTNETLINSARILHTIKFINANS